MGASDVVQETLFAANQKFKQFKGESEKELIGWLRAILKNDLIQTVRTHKTSQKRSFDREVPLAMRSSLQIQLSDEHNTPGTETLIREDAMRLQNAMSTLPEEYQQVIDLRSWQEMKFEDVGLHMNRTANAARKLWNRAILQLQQALETQSGP